MAIYKTMWYYCYQGTDRLAGNFQRRRLNAFNAVSSLRVVDVWQAYKLAHI